MHARSLLLAVLSSSALLACGGSGGGGSSAPGGGTISGALGAGPVAGARVTAYAITGGSMGAPLGSATSGADGTFTVAVGDHAGPVLLQAAGGTFTDEATGSSMPMLTGDVLTTAIPSVEAGAATTGVQVTPLTSMAQARAHAMTGGMTAANVTAANTSVGTYFSVSDIVHTAPMNPLTPGAGAGATPDARSYGMTLAAMSEYARTVGMTTSSSGMVTAMMDDASDGILDGMMGGTAISMTGMGGMMGGGMMQATAGTSGLATAMTAFVGSAMNRSGVTMADMQQLIDRLNGASGQLSPGGGTAAGTISGTAFMGRMQAGTMTAYAVVGGAMGAQLGASPVDASGRFGMTVGAYAGPVMLQLAGGSYADEATGTTMTMASGDVLTASLPAVTAGATVGGVQVTPLTSMAQDRALHMAGGMSAANVTAANAAVASYFMVDDLLMTAPMDPAVAGAGAGATVGARNHGMAIAAMSEYAKTIGMTTSSGLFTAMMEDASDGVLNGMMGSTAISMAGMGGGMMGGGMMQPTAGTSGLATAMAAFVASSRNVSGVAAGDMQPLVDKLTASSGALQ